MDFMSSHASIIVHGGAGRGNVEHAKLKLPVMRQAMEAGWKVLNQGEPSEIGVVAALKVLEECEYFNAGFGGYPNEHGIVLLDVGLMRGDRNFASVVNVRRAKYPSEIALDLLRKHKTLMTVWTHEMMTALDHASEEIRIKYGHVMRHEDLLSPFVVELLKQKNGAEIDASGRTHGTVGCVARDRNGNLSAGTSTGGINLKFNGRIGDAPLIGSGVFADNEIGALSTTGHGESFLRGLFSGFIVAELRNMLRRDPEVFSKIPKAAEAVLHSEFSELERKAPERGGAIILIPKGGDPIYGCNVPMVPLAVKSEKNGVIVTDSAFILEKNGKIGLEDKRI